MKGFEVIDISGDAGIRASGGTIKELFVSAAEGMYSLITDTEAVNEKRKVLIDVESHSLEGLLVSWLNELIFHFDTYGLIGKRITIAQAGEEPRAQGSAPTYALKSAVFGEDFDPERHERRLLLKAATYHRLSVEKRDGHWVAEVIFDI